MSSASFGGMSNSRTQKCMTCILLYLSCIYPINKTKGVGEGGGSGGLCPRTFKSGGAQVGFSPPTFGQIKYSNFAISSFFKVKNAKFSWLASLANLTLFIFSELS